MADTEFESMLNRARARRAAELLCPLGPPDSPKEDIAISLMKSALREYGKANNVRGDEALEKFVDACFEAIDEGGPLEDFATHPEDIACDAQVKIIAEKYGNAAGVNLGWATTGGEGYTSVCSKVYVKGNPCLTTRIDHETLEMTHEWE